MSSKAHSVYQTNDVALAVFNPLELLLITTEPSEL
uniref:Uncharacterized protein n=1 Tax=Moniliophthora roreri TaxID=221103 RepID=A0A0W0F434_MONRR